MTPAQQAEALVQAFVSVKGQEPTDAELENIVRLAVTPIAAACDALVRIAAALEAIAAKGAQS